MSQIMALQPTTCVILGESLNHTGLPWELDNAVYEVCELRCREVLFHLIGTLSKWILKATAHKDSWGKSS